MTRFGKSEKKERIALLEYALKNIESYL